LQFGQSLFFESKDAFIVSQSKDAFIVSQSNNVFITQQEGNHHKNHHENPAFVVTWLEVSPSPKSCNV
jgi:hypothetical protein